MLPRLGSWKKRNTARGESRSKRCKGFRKRLKKRVSQHWLSRQGDIIGKAGKKATNLLLALPPVEQEAKYRGGRPQVAAPRSHHPGILLPVIPKLLTPRHNRNLPSQRLSLMLTPNTTGTPTTLVTGTRPSWYLVPLLTAARQEPLV